MNFGGGGGVGGGVPPFGGIPPYLNGMQSLPNIPPMYAPAAHVGVVPSFAYGGGVVLPAQPMPVLPTGHGPLGDAPAKLGANGLYQAPEPDQPEQHEGAEFIKLNPAEEAVYAQLWAEAAQGDEKVGGKQASTVLSRAQKVSKSQLRLIWDIADHLREGELDRTQFYVALRLIAITQRGAEIGIKGLRNFVGIQLIPQFLPPPEHPTDDAPEPKADIPGGVATAPQAARASFSWVVTPDVISRYDGYFAGLDSVNVGFIDGATGATFFGKSGLPRPTLKTVWNLADVSKDGKLDLLEFRLAMHMVTNLRAGRITDRDLPPRLDPSGPHWLRLDEVHNNPAVQYRDETPVPRNTSPRLVADHSDGVFTGNIPSALPLTNNSHDHTSFLHAVPVHRDPTDPRLDTSRQDIMNDSVGHHVLPYAIEETSLLGTDHESQPFHKPNLAAEPDESQALRESLRKEQEEAARTHLELENMKAEMHRLRFEKANSETRSQGSELDHMKRAYEDLMKEKAKAEAEADEARAEALRLKESLNLTHDSEPTRGGPASSVGRSVQQRAIDSAWTNVSPKGRLLDSTSHWSPGSRNSPQLGMKRSDDTSPIVPVDQTFPNSNISQSGGGKDFSRDTNVAIVSPTKEPLSRGGQSTRLVSDDSLSESEDDNDFWGSSLPPKPVLGGFGKGESISNGSAAKPGGKVDNELDEWAF